MDIVSPSIVGRPFGGEGLPNINWRAVAIGAAAGLLGTVLAGLVFGTLLRVTGTEDPAAGALVAGALTGLLVAGWLAGRFATLHGPVHGSLAALITVAVVGTDALLRGSGAPPLTLFVAVLLAAVLGALGGRFGAARRPR